MVQASRRSSGEARDPDAVDPGRIWREGSRHKRPDHRVAAAGGARLFSRGVCGIALLALVLGCNDAIRPAMQQSRDGGEEMRNAGGSGETTTDPYEQQRLAMVRTQIAARGVSSQPVLAAMRKIPRHEFVPTQLKDHAYEDRPLPIGLSQTISQPYIVAAMTELAELEKGSRVLEIGTGSGYQAAVIAEIAGEVYTIEIIEELALQAEQTLRRLGYDSVHVRHGDGYLGWPEAGPFDAVVVTAAPPEVPPVLLEQLAVGGHLVIPVGDFFQQLERHTRTPDGIEKEVVFGVRFVPMVHEKAR